MPAYPLFILTKKRSALACFPRTALDRLEAVCPIPFGFRETAVITKCIVLSGLESGWA